jgi:hypothetical protein
MLNTLPPAESAQMRPITAVVTGLHVHGHHRAMWTAHAVDQVPPTAVCLRAVWDAHLVDQVPSAVRSGLREAVRWEYNRAGDGAVNPPAGKTDVSQLLVADGLLDFRECFCRCSKPRQSTVWDSRCMSPLSIVVLLPIDLSICSCRVVFCPSFVCIRGGERLSILDVGEKGFVYAQFFLSRRVEEGHYAQIGS